MPENQGSLQGFLSIKETKKAHVWATNPRNHYAPREGTSVSLHRVGEYGQRYLWALHVAVALAGVTSLLTTSNALGQSPASDGFNPGAGGSVYSLAVQADGKILVGGDFTTLGGQPRDRIGRLHADGSLDATFNPGAKTYNYVSSLVVQADGQILVGGWFDTLGGEARNNIGRLRSDGSVDNNFNPGTGGVYPDVYTLVEQVDGKILVGGCFSVLGGQTHNNIGRIRADGSVDSSFDPGAGGPVNSLVVQTDGKILMGGNFTTLGGQIRNRIGRIKADGGLDSAFNPGANERVYALALQTDGKILVGGNFTTLGGQTRTRIGRLNADGSLDNTFNPGANDRISSLVVQADGKILVGGNFTTLGGQTRNRIGRLNADGSLDNTFNPGASDRVSSLAVQTDGKILVGGNFSTLGGQARNNIGRLNNTGVATQTLSYNGSTLLWQRGGTGPEVWRTAFELTTNALDWSHLGVGSRVAGGWQLAVGSLPAQSTVRARGYVTGGDGNASSWFCVDYWGNPVVVAWPSSRTNSVGSGASFGVVGVGTAPLGYQWLKDGVALADGGGVNGARTPILNLSNVLKADEGGYSVVITNFSGAITSAVARLTVLDPCITAQPTSQAAEVNGSVSLSAVVVGTAPLHYQWLKDGVPLAQGTQATLVLTNLQGADAGGYRLVVGNGFGSVTSSVALVTVNLAQNDPGFNPGANSPVSCLALQADGKILVGGNFTTLGGQTRNRIGRLNADGSLDNTFNPGTGEWYSYVASLAVQADGKILVGGWFDTLAGQTRNNIGRLQADGSLDSTFNPGTGGVYPDVYSLVEQADGKILVGGAFFTLGGQTRDRIGRLNADGSLDSSFNPGATGPVNSMVVQADGKILVGGYFTTLGGQTRNYLGRLNANGSLDSTFNPGANERVYSLALQADGKILVGGSFTTLGGQPRNYLGRLNPNGTLDTGFNPGAGGGSSPPVSSLAVQADGKILVGGNFTTLGGQTRNYLGRLNPDGTLDSVFNPGANSSVDSLAVQADGKILVGGSFTTVGGQTRNSICRLNATDPATQGLTYDGSMITWLRGGTSPEALRTVFHWSTSGVLWTPLGEGVRVPGGWQRTNVAIPVMATIRARGFIAGDNSGSSWVVESFGTNSPGPDLRVASWDTLLQAVAGTSVSVAWTVVNRGRLAATNGWTDRVYLSPDATVGNGRLLGQFPVSGPLATNVPLARSQSVDLPSTLDPDRDYWWIIVTDSANTLGEENEANNARVSEQPMRLLSAPTPNLRVVSVGASANPMSGQAAAISWAVTNTGTWATGAGLWQDAVYVSTQPSLDNSAVLLGRTQRSRPLGTNETYASSLTATLPQGLSGARYFIVQVDADNRVPEGKGENDNITASAPIVIGLTPPPDLRVATIQVPANAASGQSIPVAWNITNAGPGVTAEADWVDDVYLSSTPTLGTNAVLLGSFPHEGALASGGSYAASGSLVLAPSLGGTFHLLVKTDARSNVFEHFFETNNTAASDPVLITLTPPPDLAVQRVDAPAKALASHSITVGYAVTNQGTETLLTFLWEDRLYLTTNRPPYSSQFPQGIGQVYFLGSTWQLGGLDSGASYTNSFSVTLPDGMSGLWYAVVETDAAGEVFELVRTNNLRASTVPTPIESRPADLVVTTLTAPSTASAGGSVLAAWTVRNQGVGDTAVTRWTDRLVLSSDAISGNADDVTLLTLEHNGLLAPGASYAVADQVVTIPFSVAPGSHHLFLLTDSDKAVHEASNEANNASAPRPIAITRTTADLRVAAVSVAPVGGESQGAGVISALSEDAVIVSWRVENTGAIAPNSTAWTDAVYLSTNTVWTTNAILLGAAQNLTSLPQGTFYTNALAVTLPPEIQGQYFIHVLADAASEVIEDNKPNNLLLATNTLSITLRPVPDLAVLSVASPADGFSGQEFELSWTITNRGPASAEGTWFDSVYLSLDTQFEPDSDIYIGYAERPHTLPFGQVYTQTTPLRIPANVSGLFHVYVLCDSTEGVNERGVRANNVGRAAAQMSVWIHPPSDLVVGTITIPTNTVSGYEMALTYVLRNQGTNAAFGPWADALYLSADDQWDIGDALFARVSQTGFLAVGSSRTNTVSSPAPGVIPGNYRVILRTDVVNQVSETSEVNNISASLHQVASQMDALELGVPATNQLAHHQARYYRVHVPAGQWLVLELNCASAAAATELFVRYGAIPSRTDFDFIHSNPLQPNQRIVVSDTREGDYYILVYGDFIPSPGTAGITLGARLSQFLVFDTTFGRGGNAGNLTIPITGVDFDRTCTARLTNASGVNRPALSHYYDSSTRFWATVDLQGLMPGSYTIVVQSSNSAPVTIPNSLEVVASGPPPPVIPVVSAPSAMSRNIAYTFTVQWANTGLNDAPAPLLTVGNTVPFGLAPGDYSLGTRYTFLGINTQGGPPGILRPGQTEMMTFHSFSGIEAGGLHCLCQPCGRISSGRDELEFCLLPSVGARQRTE